MQKHSPTQHTELVEPLTEREMEIVRLLAEGWTDRQIAEHLILAIDTVKWYNKRIYRKLLVRNRTSAVTRSRELGLLNNTSTATQQSKKTASTPHNLPAATTPFFGRELELNELTALLADETCRFVTILAAGGMGKSRFALEVAKTQLSNFRHGVYFIPLAQLRTVDNIIPTLAAHLHVRSLTEDDPTAQLLRYLQDKRVLLVLDNFEHLLDGANLITTLLEAVPHIKILATSRERLNLRTETVYALQGLALPTSTTHKDILNCSAVQLFRQRMQMMPVKATLTDDALVSVHHICQQVNGMPLGIELAASLVDVLSPAEIAAEIEHSFDVLATEMHDMPPRLRSIRAVFEYSWSQLTEAEQDVYRCLAIFRAGFTREAAKAVTGADFRVLQRLVNKSLLQREADSGRYVIHELLRQYAEEQLKASGQAASIHQAHATYYAAFMAQCGHRIKGKGQLDGLNQVEQDFENIRTAWHWAVEHCDFEVLDQMWEALYWFCVMRARVPDGKQLFQHARTQLVSSVEQDGHPVQRRLRLRFNTSSDELNVQIEQMLAIARQQHEQSEVAFLLWMLGVNRFLEGDFKKAIPLLQEAQSLLQAVGEDFYRAESLHWLGVSHRFLGQLAEAEAYARQIRELCRRTGNQFALARILGSRGIYEVFKENNAQARDDLHEAIAIRTELGDRAGVAISLAGLGFDAFFQGDFARAKVFVEDSLTRATESHSLFPKAIAQIVLGWLAAVEGEYDKAFNLCRESQSVSTNPNVAAIAKLGLAMAACGLENYVAAKEHIAGFVQSPSPLHTPRGFLSFVPVLAILYASQDEAEKAVELLALAFTHPQSPTGWMENWPLLKQWQAKLESALGADCYQAAWEEGRRLALDAGLNLRRCASLLVTVGE